MYSSRTWRTCFLSVLLQHFQFVPPPGAGCPQEVLDFVKQRSSPKAAPAAAAAAPPAKLPKLVQGGVTLIFSEEEFDAGQEGGGG